LFGLFGLFGFPVVSERKLLDERRGPWAARSQAWTTS